MNCKEEDLSILRNNRYAFNLWPKFYSDGLRLQKLARWMGKKYFNFWDGHEWGSSADPDTDFVGNHTYRLTERFGEK